MTDVDGDRPDRLRDALARAPDDRALRLQLARALLARDERAQAREVLRPLAPEAPPTPAARVTPGATWPDPVSREAAVLLARLDGEEGAHLAALSRWEQVLADDIDHAEAQAHVARLRPEAGAAPALAPGLGAAGGGATLVAPTGIRTARYEIARELGRGSTATVYLARDLELDLPVALKVLHPAIGAATREGARERFFWEARAAARLRHPGVVAVYDLDARARSLAMEYLPAGTLRARLLAARRDGDGALPVDEILATARSVLSTLAFVHDQGLIHGDLKPRNLLLRGPGQGVLCDFGVARLIADLAPGPPAPGGDVPAGTPLFLAPEQLRGAEPSVATDLFAVGAILWEMAVGQPMRTRADLLRPQLADRPLPDRVRERLAAHPDGGPIAALIDELIAHDPADRPVSSRSALHKLI